MAIVPCGKQKVQVAQVLRSQPVGLGEAFDNVAPPQTQGIPDVDGQSIQPAQPGSEQSPDLSFSGQNKTEQPAEQEPIKEDQSGSDISSYIFQKLENMGYPPRRLIEFEDDFAKERILAGDVKEVTVVMPDRYYNVRKRISDEELKSIIHEIQQKFGLSFIDASRENKKLTMNFTSEKIQADPGEETVGDDLDEVYGGGRSEAKSMKPRVKQKEKKVEPVRRSLSAEFTMNEMLKESKKDLFNTLLKKA